MIGYALFTSGVFEKKLSKYEKGFQAWAKKMLMQLSENPYAGKPLGVKWFREKKYGKWRLYYLVYDEFHCVYVVNISEKKDQQEVINSVKVMFSIYKTEIERKLGKVK